MVTGSLRTSDFDYYLPDELIAQRPASERDASRLMVLDRRTQSIEHTSFDRLTDYLHAGDALVLNRSRVIRARLRVIRPTGGSAELLLLRPLTDGQWLALGRPSRKLTRGVELRIRGGESSVKLERQLEEGQWIVRFGDGADPHELMKRFGEVPLPPYIHDLSAAEDRYQTIYGDRDGSVAAPTAGLHFTTQLLGRIANLGVDVQFVTLHVGIGTFKPVAVDAVENHTMHPEWGEVPEAVACAVNATRDRGGRVVAVGTTTTRLLETATGPDSARPWLGETNIFMYPGYRFQAVDALVTNFHLPRSTLLMLVSAFAGREFILRAYEGAVRERYRFFSFGDAMVII
jgi:S-adenosylmethionine:tRNA ribosyltransferase-isomerase